MYKVLVTHFDGVRLVEAGEQLADVKAAPMKLLKGLICEIKTVEADNVELPKRTKRRSKKAETK
jgi:hypothetical protein